MARAHKARLSGRFDAAFHAYDIAARLAATAADRADSWAGKGMAWRGLCRYREALACFQRALVCYRRIHDIEGAAFVAYARGGAQRFLGRFSEAEANLKTALRWAGDETDEAFTLMALAGMYRMTGRYRRSLTLYSRARLLGEQLHDRYIRAYAHCGVGNALRMLGEPSSARAHLDKADNLYRSIGDRVSRPYTLLAIALMDMEENRAGRLGEATRLFRITKDYRGLIHAALCRMIREKARGRDISALDKIEADAKSLGLRLEVLHARFLRLGPVPSLKSAYRKLGAKMPTSIFRLP